MVTGRKDGKVQLIDKETLEDLDKKNSLPTRGLGWLGPWLGEENVAIEAWLG